MEYHEFKKKSDDKRSVWHYFLRAADGQSGKCKLCRRIIKSSGGTTTSLRTHLRASHVIVIGNNIEEASTSGSTITSDCCHTVESTTVNDEFPPKKRTRLTDYFSKDRECLNEIIARMVSLDGLPFRTFITSEDLRSLFEKSGHRLPKSANTIKSMVMKYADTVKNDLKSEIKKLKDEGSRFCVSFDEWTSSKNRRYLNVNIHCQEFKNGNFKNLGLCRITGPMPACRLKEKLNEVLGKYNLCLSDDIICIVTDGASVMCKLGREIEPIHQLCIAHGIQLAVLDVIYKNAHNLQLATEATDCEENVEEEEAAEEEEEEDANQDDGLSIISPERVPELNSTYKELLDKVRHVVKYFRKSPTRNEVLQKYVKEEQGKELSLILDCQTRWNSLCDMVGRFVLLKSCIHKALFDTKAKFTISEKEFDELRYLHETLDVVKLTVEAICRRDANLITCDAALKFMYRKLNEKRSSLAQRLLSELRLRVNARRTSISSVAQYLHGLDRDPEFSELFTLPNNDIIMQQIVEIYERLNKYSASSNPNKEHLSPNSPNSTISPHKPHTPEAQVVLKLADELNQEILNTMNNIKKPSCAENVTDLVRVEMILYENNGEKGHYLNTVYKYLKNIPPTSVEAERAFSAAGYFSKQIRSSLQDASLDALCFLKSYFQQARILK